MARLAAATVGRHLHADDEEGRRHLLWGLDLQFLLKHVAAGHPWPHPDHPMWVFTHHKLEVPKGADVRFVQGDVRPVHDAMKRAAGGKDIWMVGGGELAAAFLDAGLLDELVITVASVTLGAGKPLLSGRHELKLLSARALGPGFAELRFNPR